MSVLDVLFWDFSIISPNMFSFYTFSTGNLHSSDLLLRSMQFAVGLLPGALIRVGTCRTGPGDAWPVCHPKEWVKALKRVVVFRPEIFYSSKIFCGYLDFFGILHLCTVIFKWVFPKMVVPQIIRFEKGFPLEIIHSGYPYFWKHPNDSHAANEHVQNARKTRRTGTKFWNCFGVFFFDVDRFFKRRETWEKLGGFFFSSKKEAFELDILVSNFLSRTEFDAIRDGHHHSDDLANPGTNGCRKLQVEHGGTWWSCFLRLNWNPTHLTSDEWIRRSLSHQEKTTFSIIPSKNGGQKWWIHLKKMASLQTFM